MKRLLVGMMVLAASLSMATTALATNGMNLEGYGPIATGMGGASMAYDNGAAAVMNNPATIGMMPEGSRLDVALGYLGPHVKASVPGMEAKSSADAFYMPAFGWVAKSGKISSGVAVFSQGGMGTEYDASSFMAQPTGVFTGDKVGSTLGVGRVMIPIVYSVTPDFTIGGTIDYVWASLDLQMAASIQQLGSLVIGGAGPLLSGLGGLPGTNWARIDFSDGGNFNGSATGSGYAAKIGAMYRINQSISIGATYHSKTNLRNLETDNQGAVLTAQGAGSVPGKIIVQDFQWPETYALGVAWNALPQLLIVFDYKQINWSDVMKNFTMTYEGGGSVIGFALPQYWERQHVYEIGLGYKFTNEFTGRVGANIANNPVPDVYTNALFPAIEKQHYTIGAGYLFSTASSMDASFTYAPKVSVTNGFGITVEHYQTNAQVMYSYRF